MFVAALLMSAMVMYGCSQADEDKTPEQIKQEIVNMDVAKIQSIIADYQEAIADKTAELEKEAAKLKEIKITEMFGEEAKAIKNNMADITKSLDKLKDNMKAYSEGLKK